MIRRPPRSTQSRSSAASDVYKRQSQSHHRIEVEHKQASRQQALVHTGETGQQGVDAGQVVESVKRRHGKPKPRGQREVGRVTLDKGDLARRYERSAIDTRMG